MCGFAGYIHNYGTFDKEEVIHKMADRIKHRGPDDAHYYIDDGIALGFRRLSIIDLEGGRQPILNEDGSLVLLFNGEIYNYQELREELIKAGHVFTTKTDSETILHGYEEYGKKILDRLRGMFAFIIWNKNTKELFGARDIFGINAELLIDHAWGWEPCTIAEIRSYKPDNNSICSGQVLQCPYTFEKTRIVVREMAEMMALDLVDKEMVTDQLVLTVGYDIENLSDPVISKAYKGEITIDRYGRSIPKHAHGTQNLSEFTNSTYEIIENTLILYDRIMNPDLLIRRITLTANHVKKEQDIVRKETYEQLDLFTDYAAVEKEKQEKEEKLQKEKKLQHAMLEIKKKYGKNAILKGTNFEEGATSIDRNQRIGGHKA